MPRPPRPVDLRDDLRRRFADLPPAAGAVSFATAPPSCGRPTRRAAAAAGKRPKLKKKKKRPQAARRGARPKARDHGLICASSSPSPCQWGSVLKTADFKSRTSPDPPRRELLHPALFVAGGTTTSSTPSTAARSTPSTPATRASSSSRATTSPRPRFLYDPSAAAAGKPKAPFFSQRRTPRAGPPPPERALQSSFLFFIRQAAIFLSNYMGVPQAQSIPGADAFNSGYPPWIPNESYALNVADLGFSDLDLDRASRRAADLRLPLSGADARGRRHEPRPTRDANPVRTRSPTSSAARPAAPPPLQRRRPPAAGRTPPAQRSPGPRAAAPAPSGASPAPPPPTTSRDVDVALGGSFYAFPRRLLHSASRPPGMAPAASGGGAERGAQTRRRGGRGGATIDDPRRGHGVDDRGRTALGEDPPAVVGAELDGGGDEDAAAAGRCDDGGELDGGGLRRVAAPLRRASRASRTTSRPGEDAVRRRPTDRRAGSLGRVPPTVGRAIASKRTPVRAGGPSCDGAPFIPQRCPAPRPTQPPMARMTKRKKRTRTRTWWAPSSSSPRRTAAAHRSTRAPERVGGVARGRQAPSRRGPRRCGRPRSACPRSARRDAPWAAPGRAGTVGRNPRAAPPPVDSPHGRPPVALSLSLSLSLGRRRPARSRRRAASRRRVPRVAAPRSHSSERCCCSAATGASGRRRRRRSPGPRRPRGRPRARRRTPRC